MKLFLDKRCQYGQIRYFPLGTEAPLLAELTGKKTLSVKDLFCLEKLGFEIWLDSVEGTQLPSSFKVKAEDL